MDPNDQGSQTDGNSPEPSQTQEGDNPVPSQEDAGQVTDQELEQMLPDQDDRGVPKENVLSEVRKKMDKVMEELNALKTLQSSFYQQPQPLQQGQQPYQQPNLQNQQQSQQIIPKDGREIAEIVRRESEEKFGVNLENANYYELRAFENQRFAELNQAMTNESIKSMQTNNTIQGERNKSENRIKDLYPDLNNLQSPLARSVVNEIQRRAYARDIDPRKLYSQDPYLIESVAPSVALQMGIAAKAQTQTKIKPRQPGLPPNNFEGRQIKPQEKIRPTQEDIIFGKKFGVKPESLAEVREKPDPTMFIDETDMLLS